MDLEGDDLPSTLGDFFDRLFDDQIVPSSTGDSLSYSSLSAAEHRLSHVVDRKFYLGFSPPW